MVTDKQTEAFLGDQADHKSKDSELALLNEGQAEGVEGLFFAKLSIYIDQ